MPHRVPRPQSATIRPKEGSQVFSRRPRGGRNPVRICPSGIAGCCGLVTLGQPKIAQGSVTPLCARGATAIPVPAQYGELINDSAAGLAMLAYVVSEGRFFALKPSDWSLLLGGVMLCGLLTLVFG